MSVRHNLWYHTRLEPETVGAFADNSQSLVGGEALELGVANLGQVSEATASSALLFGVAAGGVESGANAGFADRLAVWPGINTNLFTIVPDVFDATNIDIEKIGTFVDLIIDSDGFHRVNLDASTTDVFTLVDIPVTKTDGIFPVDADDPMDVVRNVVVIVNPGKSSFIGA